MGRGVLNFPIEKVAELLAEDMEKMRNWEKYLAEIKCIKQLSNGKSDIIVYRRYQATGCLVNTQADLVYYSRANYHDEKFVLTGVSVSDTFYPSTPGIVRAKVLPGSGYVLEPYLADPNRTLITYIAALIVDGVPAVVLNKVLKNLSVSIHYLNQYLKKIWMLDPMALQEVLYSIEATSDAVSELQQSYDYPANNAQSKKHSNGELSEAQATATIPYQSEESTGALRKNLQLVSDLKLYKDGELDWEALGRETTRCILEEVENISTLDKKYGSGSREPINESDWRFVHEKHDVVVYTKKEWNSKIDCFLGRGVVNAPMRQVGDFTANIQSTYKWDNTLIDVKYVKVIKKSQDCTDYVGYQRHETTKCMVHARRDNLYFVRCIYTNGKYVQAAVSVSHPECPPPLNTTRIKVYSGSGWVMEPYCGSETQTLVTYLAHVDLIGLPAIITNFILKRHPLAIHYVRLHLPPFVPSLDTITSSPYHTENEGDDIDRRLDKGWRING